MQQGENSGLICTSDEGAVVRCSLAQTETGKAACIQCSIPGGTTVSLTADGQVQLGRTYDRICLLLGFTACATFFVWRSPGYHGTGSARLCRYTIWQRSCHPWCLSTRWQHRSQDQGQHTHLALSAQHWRGYSGLQVSLQFDLHCFFRPASAADLGGRSSKQPLFRPYQMNHIMPPVFVIAQQ